MEIYDFHVEITYNVPSTLAEELELYITEDIGQDGRYILSEDVRDEENDRIKGSILLEFDGSLRSAMPIIQEIEDNFKLMEQGKSIYVG